ncbi:MAG: MATE family efflux transporter [Steroidobacteraceae bacterium]
MKDFSQGSIRRHLIGMAAPMAAGMVFQTLYYLIDLYFVARLGDAAIAGVSAAGNLTFITLAMTQVLGVGTIALVAQAVGRKDRGDANLVFNQSLLLSAACALITLLGGYPLVRPYMEFISADRATAAAGTTYLYWFLPAMALQFAFVAMSSALRGTGIIKPAMIVQALTVILNALLAPVFIAGWLIGYPMGVAGAGLASTLALVMGVVLLLWYFLKLEKYVAVAREQLAPRMAVWRRMLFVGLPAGGEFLVIFAFTATIYWVIRDFGATAQAGFGIGSRIMQAIFLPAMAVAFSAAPVAGQNFGAGRGDRVRQTFRESALLGGAVMATATLLCQWHPDVLIGLLTHEPPVIEVGARFLQVISWNFVLIGFNFTCSSLFQALGNTLPSLLSTTFRLLCFAIPAIWLSTQPGFDINYVWYLSVGTVAVQAAISYLLLRREMDKRLGRPAPRAAS